jgi:hypothetical protein
MLGLHDMSVLAAYMLSILSTVLCVVYGIARWNKDSDSADTNKSKKGGRGK